MHRLTNVRVAPCCPPHPTDGLVPAGAAHAGASAVSRAMDGNLCKDAEQVLFPQKVDSFRARQCLVQQGELSAGDRMEDRRAGGGRGGRGDRLKRLPFDSRCSDVCANSEFVGSECGSKCYYTVVVEDIAAKKIVATATLFVEVPAFPASCVPRTLQQERWLLSAHCLRGVHNRGAGLFSFLEGVQRSPFILSSRSSGFFSPVFMLPFASIDDVNSSVVIRSINSCAGGTYAGTSKMLLWTRRRGQPPVLSPAC